MKSGEECFKLVKAYEGCKLKAYLDGGGVWTIGIGHTGPEVKKGLVITEAQARAYFEEDIKEAENDVNRLVKVSLTQNQYDALVSFTFNLGGTQLGKSTLLKLVNARAFNGAGDQFLRWNKDNGQVVAGLTKRRIAEKNLFDGRPWTGP